MARREIVTLTDDLDGSDADETVSFSFDGKGYIIDLSQKNAARLRKLIEPYISAGRRDRGSSLLRQRSSSPTNGEAAAIRAWAVEQGYEVNARGRISADIVAAYNAS